jgi:uncharacterized protein YbbC (DUF1343 family)
LSNVRTGLDVLLADLPDALRGRRIGLICHRASVDSTGKHIIDLIAHQRDCALAAVFAPEHGLSGEAAAGEPVASQKEPLTGVPVHSLYGEVRKPSPEMMGGVDVLVCDLQDVGVRFYTYASTMALAMEAAAELGILFVVLDRPNPIRGDRVEGPLLEPDFRSFVGMISTPVRHGLTMGELSLLANEAADEPCDLTVVPMAGWRRTMWHEDSGLPWIPPSPGIPDLATAAAYPGMCLLEGTNLSVGRGTPRPFLQVGAPWIDRYMIGSVIGILSMSGIGGVAFEPASFVPGDGTYRGEPCEGISLRVKDRDVFDPIATALWVVAVIRGLFGQQFAWTHSGERFWFDLLAGTDRVRKTIEANLAPPEIVASWQAELDAFASVRERYLLYR